LQNHYKTLRLSNFASIEEIKKVYKTLAKKYHPDKNPNNKKAEEYFKEISNAYNVLSSPEKKRAFDRKLTYALSRPSTPRPTPPRTAAARNTTKTTTRKQHTYRPYTTKGKSKTKRKVQYKTYLVATICLGILSTLLVTGGKYLNTYSAKKYYTIAKEHLAHHEYSLAEENIYEAKFYETYLSEIYELEGDIRIAKNNVMLALDSYEKAINHAKTSRYELIFKKAKTLVMTEQYQEAIIILEDVITQPVQQDSAFLYLGELYLRLETNYLKAVHCFNQYEKLSPISNDSKVLYNLRGYAHLKLGHFDLAIKDLERNVAMKPTSLNYHLLSQAYIRNNMHSKCCASLEKAIALNSENKAAILDYERYKCSKN